MNTCPIMLAGLLALSSASHADITDGLLAHWILDGDATDVSGNGHHGSLDRGSPTACEDRFGDPSGATCFDGNDGFVVPGSGLHPFHFAATAWVKTTQIDYGTVLTSDPDSAQCSHGLGLVNYDGVTGGYVDGSTACGPNVAHVLADDLLSDGTWHHIAMVYDDALAVFVDGVRRSSWVDSDYVRTFASLRIGVSPRSVNDGIGDRPFVGAIDDLRYYNRPLTQAELFQLAREGEPCPADWNLDGMLDTADFLAFLNDYSSMQNGGDPAHGNADLAAPFDVINTADFVAYLGLFAAGCP